MHSAKLSSTQAGAGPPAHTMTMALAFPRWERDGLCLQTAVPGACKKRCPTRHLLQPSERQQHPSCLSKERWGEPGTLCHQPHWDLLTSLCPL